MVYLEVKQRAHPSFQRHAYVRRHYTSMLYVEGKLGAHSLLQRHVMGMITLFLYAIYNTQTRGAPFI